MNYSVSSRAVSTAIDIIDKYLSSIMVKSDENEKPEDTHNDEDKNFLDGILKKSPKKNTSEFIQIAGEF